MKRSEHAIQVNQRLFRGLHQVWAAVPSEQWYNTSIVAKVTLRMGLTEVHNWITQHPDRYGYTLFYGTYVDEEYPPETEK